MKKIIVIIIGIIILIVLIGTVFKPVIIQDSHFYYRVNTLDEYILYKMNYNECADMEEEIYEDNDNIYIMPCLSSHYYLITSESDQFTMGEGLVENKITIEELVELMDGRLLSNSKLE
jgi:hypothetical protein